MKISEETPFLAAIAALSIVIAVNTGITAFRSVNVKPTKKKIKKAMNKVRPNH